MMTTLEAAILLSAMMVGPLILGEAAVRAAPEALGAPGARWKSSRRAFDDDRAHDLLQLHGQSLRLAETVFKSLPQVSVCAAFIQAYGVQAGRHGTGIATWTPFVLATAIVCPVLHVAISLLPCLSADTRTSLCDWLVASKSESKARVNKLVGSAGTVVTAELAGAINAAVRKGVPVTQLAAAISLLMELRCEEVQRRLEKDGPDVVATLRAEGFVALDMMAAGVDRGLKAAGFSALELKRAGCDARALSASGFSLRALRKVGYTATQLKLAGFDAAALMTAGLDASALRDAGFDAAALRAAGIGLRVLKAAGFDAAALRLVGRTAAELKSVGFGVAELHTAGFDARAITGAGFSLSTLGSVFDAGALRSIGFELALLKTRFNLRELKAAGYDASQLRAAGFVARSVRDAGARALNCSSATRACQLTPAAMVAVLQVLTVVHSSKQGTTPKPCVGLGSVPQISAKLDSVRVH